MAKCNSVIRFGDHGDNGTTFHCNLESGHEGEHKKVGNKGSGIKQIPYTITWEGCSDTIGWDNSYKDDDKDAYSHFEKQYDPDHSSFQKTRKKNTKGMGKSIKLKIVKEI